MAEELDTRQVVEEFNPKEMSVKERIIRISNELRVEKTGWNAYSTYAYNTPSDIDNPLKPLLLKYRLFPHFALRKKENNKNEAVLRVEDFDSEDGRQIYTMTTEDITLKAANTAQSSAGLRTFCRRYLLMTAFNISDDESDYDAQDSADDKKQGKKSAVGEPKEEKKNPDEKLKEELIDLCRTKISEAKASGKEKEMREAVDGVNKKYEPKTGSIKDMTTQNVKMAISDIKKLTV
jgi:hypothetical protein